MIRLLQLQQKVNRSRIVQCFAETLANMEKEESPDIVPKNFKVNAPGSSGNAHGYSSRAFYDKFYSQNDALGSVNDTFSKQVVLSEGTSHKNPVFHGSNQVGSTAPGRYTDNLNITDSSSIDKEVTDKLEKSCVEKTGVINMLSDTHEGTEQKLAENEMYFVDNEIKQQGFIDDTSTHNQSEYQHHFDEKAHKTQHPVLLAHGFWCPNPVDAAVPPYPRPRTQFRTHGIGPAFPRYNNPRGWRPQGPQMGELLPGSTYHAWHPSPYSWTDHNHPRIHPQYQKRNYSRKPPSNKPSKEPHQAHTDLEAKNKREEELLRRQWEDFEDAMQVYSENPDLWLCFSVASYNILSQNLCDYNDFLYKHCEPSALEWDNRRQRLMREISYHKPDILCLQEVNATHYSDFFVEEFNQLGYNSVFKKRTGDKEDGCAIVYKEEKFVLAGHQGVEYFKSGISLLDRDNVGLVAVLKCVDTEKRCATMPSVPPYICVANTHLLFNLKRGDIKLAQMQILLSEIDEWAAKYVDQINRRYDPTKTVYAPVIMCGDFNSLPFSPLYNFITTGHIKYAGMDAKTICQSGVHGVTRILKNRLIPESVGITNKCRKMALLEQQIFKYNKRTEVVRKQKVHELAILKAREKTAQCEENLLQNSECASHMNQVSGTSQTESFTESCTASSKNVNPHREASNKHVEDSAKDIDEQVSEEEVHHTRIECSIGETSQNNPANYEKDFSHIMDRPVKGFADSFSISDGTLSHPFSFKSVYNNFSMNQNSAYYGCPYVTTSHSKASEMVDFIFYFNPKKKVKKRYPPNFLMCQSRLGLLTDKQMDELGRLPNDIIGSDHCMLLASFMLYNTYFEWKMKQSSMRKRKHKKRKNVISTNHSDKKKKNSNKK